MPNALNNIIVTTADLKNSRSYYTDGLQLIPAEETEPEVETMRKLWGLDRTYPIQCLVLKRKTEYEHGYIRLVQLKGASGYVIRENARPWDYGLFDFGFVVKDHTAKIKTIQDLGFEVFAPPTRYDFGYYNDPDTDRDPYYVIDSVVKGPDGVLVDFLERFNPPHPYGTIDPATGFTEVIHSLVVVDEMDKALDFFHHLLDIPIRGAFKNVCEPQFERMLKIPPDEIVDWSFVADIDSPGSFVEIISFHRTKGRQIAGQKRLLNYGISGLSFCVEDLDRTYAKMETAKIEIVCEPIPVTLAGPGKTRAFSCYGPSGIFCEVFQAQ